MKNLFKRSRTKQTTGEKMTDPITNPMAELVNVKISYSADAVDQTQPAPFASRMNIEFDNAHRIQLNYLEYMTFGMYKQMAHDQAEFWTTPGNSHANFDDIMNGQETD